MAVSHRMDAVVAHIRTLSRFADFVRTGYPGGVSRTGHVSLFALQQRRLSDEEVGAELVPGQADSAPHKFDLKRHMLRASIVALVLFAIYYANWAFEWVTVDDLDFFNPPAAQDTI